MQKFFKRGSHKKQEGNVLFLILIAVALFAALSYAVTQSTRSSGNADEENALISGAQITQFPASVKTAVIRMIIAGSINKSDLEFNLPSGFANCSGTPKTLCVFHPEGGGASYTQAPGDVATTGAGPQDWVFNGENEVTQVGTSDGTTPTATTSEIIAFLPNISANVCRKINVKLGLGSAAITETGINVAMQMDHAYAGMGGGGVINGNTNQLVGHAFGCFEQSSVNYYYHVLVEG